MVSNEKHEISINKDNTLTKHKRNKHIDGGRDQFIVCLKKMYAPRASRYNTVFLTHFPKKLKFTFRRMTKHLKPGHEKSEQI